MRKTLYVRSHHVVTWETAEELARTADVSMSEYVATALREKIERDTGEDTSVPAHLFPRRRAQPRGGTWVAAQH